MEHFFMHQEYYTLIFDNNKQKALLKDTTIDHVVVEKIFFTKGLVQQFLFNRINGQWMMTSIGYEPIKIVRMPVSSVSTIVLLPTQPIKHIRWLMK